MPAACCYANTAVDVKALRACSRMYSCRSDIVAAVANQLFS